MRKIGVTKPYPFEDYLIIGISKQWLNVCTDDLSFKIILDDKGRLCLISNQCLKK